MGQKTIWETAKGRLLVALYTVLYFVVVPSAIIIFLPFYLFRFILSQLRKVFRKDLDKLVNTRSSVLARDEWTKNPRWNLVVWLTQEGILDLERFRKEFYEEYVIRETPEGKLMFPEYQQHYTKWWGFLFWRWEDTFDVREHIRPYDGEHVSDVVDKKHLIKIVKELTWKAWPEKKSPWEFLQIKNYKDNGGDGLHKSLLFFRIHHGLGDGYYILKLLMEDISGISLERALGKPRYIQRGLWEKLSLSFMFWIRIPYQFVEMLVMAEDVNQWHLPMDKLSYPFHAALTDPIPLRLIRDIKNSQDVSFTAVIMAAITGGIRELMLSRGIPVPVHMNAAVPVPMPGHPPKLRNHFIFSFFKMPIGVSDPLKRLKKTQEYYLNLKRSTAPLTNFVKIPIAGGLPAAMMTGMCVNEFSTCLVSNFPGTAEVPNFKGTNVLDMMFNAGLGEGGVGLGFCLISYVDHITLMSQADGGILPADADVEELNAKILEQLDIFRNLAIA